MKFARQRVTAARNQEHIPAGPTFFDTGKALFVAALLTMAGFALCQPANAAGKTRQARDNVSTILKNIRKTYGESSDYSGLDTSKGVASGIIPRSMVEGLSGNVRNVWGGDVKLGVNDEGQHYLLYRGVPRDACVAMAHAGPGPLSDVVINLRRLEASTTREGIESKCSASGSGQSGGNILIWGF